VEIHLASKVETQPERSARQAAPNESANLLRFRARGSSQESAKPLQGTAPADFEAPEDYWSERARLAKVDFEESAQLLCDKQSRTRTTEEMLKLDREVDHLLSIPQENVRPPAELKNQ
jgi:hypothetical protein